MTQPTFSTLYAEDFSLHNIVVNRTWQLVGTEMTEVSWGGNLVFEDPGGENWGRESKFSPKGRGEPTPLDTMVLRVSRQASPPQEKYPNTEGSP